MHTSYVINKMTAVLRIDDEIIQVKELPEMENHDCIYGVVYEYDNGMILIKWVDDVNEFYVYNKSKFIEKTPTPSISSDAKLVYTKVMH